jgi:GNAT superfamily N-acetyltransferase
VQTACAILAAMSRSEVAKSETIRQEPLDAPAARKLVAAFELEIKELYPSWSASVGPTAKPEEFRPPDGCFVVAYAGDRPVGCGGVKRLDERTAEIKRMYVEPESRGMGVARRILARLEAEAGGAGYRAVRLDTGDRQPEALALYRSAGYAEIPDYNGNPPASFWFEKAL